MKISVPPVRAGFRASNAARGGPPALLLAAGAALMVVLALAIYALWVRHDATGSRDSAVYDGVLRAETTPARLSRGGEHSQPGEPAPAASGARAPVPAPEPSAVAPAAKNGEPSSGCDESSHRFREIVAPCFDSQDLCNVGVTVRFDGDGHAIDVSLTSEVAPEIAERAREARACVARSFAKLTTPCSKSKSVHYAQRCTLH